MVYRIGDTLAGWGMPARCVLCGSQGRRRRYDLCADCAADLPRAPRACSRCGQPEAAGLGAAVARCESCAIEPPPYHGLFAPFDYAFPLDRLIQTLKYQGALANARVLGTLLAHEIERSGHHGDVDLLVPMPLHISRLVERGFNQSHEIALFAGDVLGRGIRPGALRRVRATAAQVGLDRAARLQNVLGAFTAVPRDVTGRRIALVDDVVTTGSTAAAAARALRQAGASQVVVWALARAAQR